MSPLLGVLQPDQLNYIHLSVDACNDNTLDPETAGEYLGSCLSHIGTVLAAVAEHRRLPIYLALPIEATMEVLSDDVLSSSQHALYLKGLMDGGEEQRAVGIKFLSLASNLQLGEMLKQLSVEDTASIISVLDLKRSMHVAGLFPPEDRR